MNGVGSRVSSRMSLPKVMASYRPLPWPKDASNILNRGSTSNYLYYRLTKAQFKLMTLCMSYSCLLFFVWRDPGIYLCIKPEMCLQKWNNSLYLQIKTFEHHPRETQMMTPRATHLMFCKLCP